MVVTKEVDLPKFEDLDVPEVNLSASVLMAAAPYVGKMCEGVNTEFMLCRQELEDARACVDVGKKVTNCSMQAFQNIKKYCCEEFVQYVRCIDQSSGNYGFSHCRNTQAVFDKCMFDNVCIERPHFGHFTRGRVHETTTACPIPPPCPCKPAVPDPTPALPDCKPRLPARFSGRLFWVTE